MLATTLRYLAGAICLDVAWAYGIGLPIVYSSRTECLTALNESLDNTECPKSAAQCEESTKAFQELRKFRMCGVTAGMDGIAVSIRKPKAGECPNPRTYFIRKCFYSICVQAAVCTACKACFVYCTTHLIVSTRMDFQGFLPSLLTTLTATAHAACSPCIRCVKHHPGDL